ncbi:natural resistance-associated macrophage protein isotype II, partial [Aphelenchoides avenae]
IPLFAGVLITMLDTFTFLFIDRYGFRKLEILFALLISTMALSFGYEFFIVKPEGGEILKGMFIPWCEGCGQKEFLQGVSIVGAVIMPHNLYLHSALVKSRNIDRTKKRNVTEANLYYFIESGIALAVSFVINLFVVAVFAHGLFNKTNADVLDTCAHKDDLHPELIFPNNTEAVDADIYKAGVFLGCEFGLAALYVWGVGIMAAGQSSTMTGTYAGQFVMEGFLQIMWPRWKRVLVTRSVAIVPTLIVALWAGGVDKLTGMNDLLNTLQMIQLPFALIPIITFTSHNGIMFEYKSSKIFQYFALAISLVIIAINLYFTTDFVLSNVGQDWWVWPVLSVPCVLYILFVLYLIFTCLQSMGVVTQDFYDKISWLSCKDRLLSIDSPWRREQGSPTGVSTTTTSTESVGPPLTSLNYGTTTNGTTHID